MKTENNHMQYDIEFLEKVFAYLNDYSILEIDINNVHNFSTKEKHTLMRLKDIYSKVKLFKDYQTVSLEHFSDEDVLAKANSFLIRIFPKRKQEILELDDLIYFGDYSIYDAGLMYHWNFDKILIPTDGTNYTSATIVHEKVHALTFQNIDLVSLFVNNLELFPMFIERMMLNSINDPFCDILNRVVRINDTKECFKFLDLMNGIKNNPDKTSLDEYVYNYLYLRSYDYLISEMYSDLLFKYYLLDRVKMIEKLNQVFNQKISISDFLNNYHINLLNKDLISTIKEETNKCKRISIIP